MLPRKTDIPAHAGDVRVEIQITGIRNNGVGANTLPLLKREEKMHTVQQSRNAQRP